MLRVHTLGGLSIQSGGQQLSGRSTQPRRLAVMALIARSGDRGMTRDRLLALLWPDTDGDSGRRALAQALHTLRKEAGREELFLGVQELRLNPEVASCDAPEMEAAIRAGELERAFGLYAGPFLDGFRLGGAPELERWIEEERSVLARAHAELIEKLARRAAETGDFAAAAAWWRRRAGLDPLNARVATQLMEALVAAGEQAAALQHARIHEALMEQELELPPDRAVVELAERIRSGALVRQATTPPESAPPLAAAGAPEPPPETVRPDPDLEPGNRPAGPGASGLGPSASPPPTPSGPAAPAGEPETRPWRLHRSLRVMAGAASFAVLLLVAGVVWILTGRTGGLIRAGLLDREEVILLGDLASPSGDSMLAALATEALRIDLSHSRLFALVDPADVRHALRRMDRPAGRLDPDLARELALREGVRATIEGEVVRAGASYVFTGRITAAETGRTLASVRETAHDSTQIMDAVDRLSASLRSRVGESFRMVQSAPRLASVTTPSLDALRLYTQATRLMTSGSEYPSAIRLLEEAIEIDPGFASAYRALEVALGNTGSDHSRRVEASRRAFELRSRATERERHSISAAYFRMIGDTDRAIAEYRASLELVPRNGPVRLSLLNNLAMLYGDRHDYESAELNYRLAIAADSLGSYLPYMNLQRALVIQGRLDDAEQVIDRMEQLFPGVPTVPIARAALLGVRGEYEAAEAEARTLLASHGHVPSWRIGGDRMLGHLFLLQGRAREAEELFEEVARTSERAASPASYLTAQLEIAALDVLVRGDPTRGNTRVEGALGRYPLEALPVGGRPYLSVALYFALAGEPARAQAILAAFERNEPEELRRGAGRAEQLTLGALALAENRPLDAIPLLRAADTEGCTNCVLPLLGAAYERTDRPASAIAAYQRYLDDTWPDRAAPWFLGPWEARGDAFWRVQVLERLAALNLEGGDTASANRFSAEIRRLRANGDAGLRGGDDSLRP